jgi:hypothetical protein
MNADDLFASLEPPPGGAERFAQRLERAAAAEAAARRRRPALAAAAAFAGIALVATFVLLRRPADVAQPVAATPAPAIYDAPEFDRLLGRPLPVEQLTAVVDDQAATVTELESHNAKVRIYRLN